MSPGRLPEALGRPQKKNKIRNMLQEMVKLDGAIVNAGGRGKGAKWVLVQHGPNPAGENEQ